MSEGGRSHLLNFDDNFLAAAVNDVQTTITVQTEAIHPVVPFYFVIDPFNFENYEVLYCTEIVGTTWTVVRNLAGTKGTTHSLINGDANRIRFAYAQQQLDDLWVALGTVADNLNLAPYTHRTAVDAVTAAGEYKRNNADVTLATELYVNELDNGGGSLTNLLESLRDGDVLLFSSIDNDGVEAYNITGVAVLNAITYTIPVSGNQVDGTGFLDLESTAMRIVFGRNVKLGGLADVEVAGVEDQQVLGFKASSGEWVPITNTANKGITSLDYLYDANQTASPVAGDVAPNNATPSLTTNLAISNTDANGDDLSFVLANLKAGDLLVIQQKADGANREDYTIVSNTDQGTFRDLVVTFDSAAGTINDNDPVFVHTLAQLPDLDAVYLRLDTTNDPLTGDLAMGSTKLTGLLDGFDPQDSVSKLQTETDAQARAEAEAIKRMQWLNVWAPGTYEEFDTVFDQQFTMVANKQTSDRAAPQPVGNSSFLLPDDGSNWDGTDPSFVGLVSSANRYTFAVFAVVSAFRVFIPAGSDDTIEYRVYTQDRTDPADILTDVGPTFTTTVTDDWLTVNVAGVLAGVGTILEVGLISLNSNAGTDDTFQWNTLGDSNLEDNPGVGNSESNNADDVLRINDTDANAGDQTALLATIIPGSTITVASVSNPAAFTLYQVTAATDFVGYRSFAVQIVTSGLGGHLRGQLSNIRIQVPIPQATEYVESTAGWSTTPTGFADVQGVLDEGGTGGVVSANAYGTDIEVQAYTSSPDWDFLALSGGSGGGGGGGGPAPNGLPVGGVAGDVLTKVDATDFNSEWTDGDTVWLPLAGGLMTGDIDLDDNNLRAVNSIRTRTVDAVGGAVRIRINNGGTLDLRDDLNVILQIDTAQIRALAPIDLNSNAITEAVSIQAAAASPLRLVDDSVQERITIRENSVGDIEFRNTAGTIISRWSQGGGVWRLDTALNMNSNNINNVLDPTLAQQAATKNYVDTAGLYLPLAGGTMSGVINMGGFDIQDIAQIIGRTTGDFRLIAGTGQSLILRDNAGVNRVTVTGGSNVTILDESATILAQYGFNRIQFAGRLDMSTNKIENVVDPTANQDAATKGYVDTRDALYLPLAGGTLTGDLLMSGADIEMGSNSINWASNGAAIGFQGNNQGLSMELGQMNDIGVTPFIDFHTGHLTTDFSARLIAIGDENTTQNAGGLSLSGSQGLVLSNGPINLNSQGKVINLVDGVDAQDAVSKAQLDAATGGFDGSHDGLSDAVGSGLPWEDKHHVRYTDSDAVDANTGLWLSLGGGTLTGVILGANGLVSGPMYSFSNFPTTGMYVDGGGGLRWAFVGVSKMSLSSTSLAMAATIDMNSNPLIDLIDPTNPQDAASKAYVDLFLPLTGGVLSGTLEVNERLTVRNVDGVVSGFMEGFPGVDRQLVRIGPGPDAVASTFLQIIGPGDTASESFAFRLSGAQVLTLNPGDITIAGVPLLMNGNDILNDTGGRIEVGRDSDHAAGNLEVGRANAGQVIMSIGGDGGDNISGRRYLFKRAASFGDLEFYGVESAGTETHVFSIDSSGDFEIMKALGQNERNIRNVTHDNAAPSGGIDGDVWLVIP